MTTNTILTRLLGLELIVVTGKGGVGKSSVSAVLGRLLSDAGRQTLLIEVDPRENLHHLLDVPPSGGEMVEVSPRLRVQHLLPRTILDDLVREKLKVGPLVKRVLASPIHQHFTEAAPGIKEAAVFGRCLRLLEGHGPRGVPRPDVVILDAPATGHGASWLGAAQLVSDVISSGPIGHMASLVAEFLTDPARSGVVVVTSGEEMPVQETLEFLETMETRLHRRPELVIANALYPQLTEDVPDDPNDPLLDLWVHRRAINEEELDRLAREWDGPVAHLPLLPLDPGPALVGRLGRRLKTEMGGGA